jgi:hypothetical protein
MRRVRTRDYAVFEWQQEQDFGIDGLLQARGIGKND